MSSSLSNLKPNHVPSQQFELAPGWFILLMIGLVTSLYFILFFIKKYQQNSYRRLALKKIKKIELRWKSSGSYDDIIQISLIIKNVAFEIDSKSSSLSGKEWITFIKRHCPSISENSFQLLNKIQYSSPQSITKISESDISLLFQETKKWICKHRITEVHT